MLIHKLNARLRGLELQHPTTFAMVDAFALVASAATIVIVTLALTSVTLGGIL